MKQSRLMMCEHTAHTYEQEVKTVEIPEGWTAFIVPPDGAHPFAVAPLGKAEMADSSLLRADVLLCFLLAMHCHDVDKINELTGQLAAEHDMGEPVTKH